MASVNGVGAGGRPWARAEGLALAVATLLGWSSSPLFIKHFAGHMDVWTSNGWRYGFSAVLWAPVLVWGARRRTLPAGLWRAALVPSIFNALGQAAFAAAFYRIDPALGTFGLRTQVVFVAVGAAILFPAERRVIRSPLFLAGLVLVFGGTMATVVMDAGFGQRASAAGVALAVASGLLFAGYALAVRHYAHGMNSLQAFAAISQYTAAIMVGMMLAFGTPASWRGLVLPGLSPINEPWREVGLLLLSAFIGIAVGHVLYYAAIARLGVAVSSGVIQLQPIVVGAATALLFKEEGALTAWQWLTGSVAVVGTGTILLAQHLLSRGGGDAVTEFAELPVDAVAGAAAGERVS